MLILVQIWSCNNYELYCKSEETCIKYSKQIDHQIYSKYDIRNLHP